MIQRKSIHLLYKKKIFSYSDKKKAKKGDYFISELIKILKAILSNIWGIILFKDLIYSLTAFIEMLLFYKIFKKINYLLLCLVIGNVIIFYYPIEKKWPKFLFRCRMFIKEIIEGIICIIITLIPIGDKTNK